MRARRLVWLLLVGNLAACRSKSEQAPSPPPSGGSGAAGSTGSAAAAIADAGVPVAVAVVDAEADDAGADAGGLDAAPQTIELGTEVPGFGCLGWSPQRGSPPASSDRAAR